MQYTYKNTSNNKNIPNSDFTSSLFSTKLSSFKKFSFARPTDSFKRTKAMPKHFRDDLVNELTKKNVPPCSHI